MNPLRRAAARIARERRLRGVTRGVAALDIAEAGQAADGTPFVRLVDGPIFFGLPTRDAYRPYHRLLPSEQRGRIPEMAFQVALDIVIRYREGGLQLGGPRKEARYRVQPGDHVAEMGAYQGFFTVHLAERVGPGGRVVAIEPVPENVALLERNMAENGLSQVTVVPRGVWKAPANVSLSLRPHDMQSASMVLDHAAGQGVDVAADSLDNILATAGVDHIDLMLIQLNGVEMEALEGLTTIAPRHLAIAARYGGRSDAHAIARFLESRGYTTELLPGGFVFAEGGGRPDGAGADAATAAATATSPATVEVSGGDGAPGQHSASESKDRDRTDQGPLAPDATAADLSTAPDPSDRDLMVRGPNGSRDQRRERSGDVGRDGSGDREIDVDRAIDADRPGSRTDLANRNAAAPR